MKKLIFTAACLLFAVVANAGDGKFGIIGGLTTSTTNIKEATQLVKSGSVSNYHIGVTYNKPLALGFALQPSLLYNVKGAEVKNVTGLGDFDFSAGFIEVPLQIQWSPITILKVAKPYVFAEPFVGYAVNSKAQSSVGGSAVNWDKVKAGFEGGLGLGAGVTVINHVQVAVKYYWNFGPLYTADISVESIADKIKNNSCNGLTVSAAFLF